MIELPASVVERLDQHPIVDVILDILREDFPDIDIGTLIPPNPTFPFVLVRKGRAVGEWTGDPRFTDASQVEIQVFTEDPDGEPKGELISLAIAKAMHEAGMTRRNVPGKGSIIAIYMTDEPRRAPDWATSQGPVQYADLPAGVWRHETKFDVSIRKKRA